MTEISACTQPNYRNLCGVNVLINPIREVEDRTDCILVIGQKSGMALAGDYTIHKVLDNTRLSLFGARSMLNEQIEDIAQIAPTATVYAYVVPEVIGTPGTSDVTLPDVSTEATSGTYYKWINGQRYGVSYDPAVDDDTTLAAKFAAAINGSNTANYTATEAAGVLTITTDGTGEIGGFLDVRCSYGCQPLYANTQPATIVTTPATGLPDLSGLPAEKQCCTFVANPYTDSASMGFVKDYTCKTWSGNGCEARSYGVYYGNYAQSEATALNCNNPLTSYEAVRGGLTPPALETASFAALMWLALNRNAQGIAENVVGTLMPNMLAPELADQWTPQEISFLEEAGMGAFEDNGAKGMVIATATTTYRTADNGTADDTYRCINAPAIDAALRDTIRRGLDEKYLKNGYAFRSDGIVGTRCRTKIATPEMVRNCLLNLMQRASECNWIQDYQSLVDTTIVEVVDECMRIIIDPQRVKPFCCIDVSLRPRNNPISAVSVF